MQRFQQVCIYLKTKWAASVKRRFCRLRRYFSVLSSLYSANGRRAWWPLHRCRMWKTGASWRYLNKFTIKNIFRMKTRHLLKNWLQRLFFYKTCIISISYSKLCNKLTITFLVKFNIIIEQLFLSNLKKLPLIDN